MVMMLCLLLAEWVPSGAFPTHWSRQTLTVAGRSQSSDFDCRRASPFVLPLVQHS